MFCGKCGAQMDVGATFCPKCGAKVAEKPTFCGKCGAQMDAGAAFCPKCGNKNEVKEESSVLKDKTSTEPEELSQEENQKETEEKKKAKETSKGKKTNSKGEKSKEKLPEETASEEEIQETSEKPSVDAVESKNEKPENIVEVSNVSTTESENVPVMDNTMVPSVENEVTPVMDTMTPPVENVTPTESPVAVASTEVVSPVLPVNGMETGAPVLQGQPVMPVANKKKKLWIWIGVAAVVVVVVVVAVLFLLHNGDSKRAKVLVNIEKSPYLKFTVDGQDFYLGDVASTYKDKGYTYQDDYLTDEDRIVSDSISVHPFYHDDESKFLGALYCSKNEDCTYDESILVKVNFYDGSNVVVNDFLKYNLTYDEIVEKYGKEDGTFYQDEDSLVWSFGEKGKIGQPYYILRFSSGSFTSKRLQEIKIGVWWYEGEYQHTVVKSGGSK